MGILRNRRHRSKLPPLRRIARGPQTSHSRPNNELGARKTPKTHRPSASEATRLQDRQSKRSLHSQTQGAVPRTQDMGQTRGMVKNSGLPPSKRGRGGAGRAGPTNHQPNAVRRKKVPQTKHGPLRIQPRGQRMARQMPRPQGSTATENRKEGQKQRKRQKVRPTMRHCQPGGALGSRTGANIQRMQNQDEEANGRIAMDAERIPDLSTPRSHGRGKNGRSNQGERNPPK